MNVIKCLCIHILLTGSVVAQTVTMQKPLHCGDTKTVIQGLTGENVKEKPIWWGTESQAPLPKYSLFVNEQTRTWTLIQFDDNMACVLGVGEASTEIFNGPKI